jgi:hypothetical protein
MNKNKPISRGQFLTIVFGIAIGAVIAKATSFIPTSARETEVAYGHNTYGGKA